jgi:DNA-binding transcriptional LysR family regulator
MSRLQAKAVNIMAELLMHQNPSKAWDVDGAQDLRYFVAVVEEGSLTTAAELRLHTSQPSLSRQIRDLEHQVGAELLSRSVHGVELTAAGRAFLEHVRLALAQGEAPTIDLAVGYSKANTSPILKLFLSRLEELRGPMQLLAKQRT